MSASPSATSSSTVERHVDQSTDQQRRPELLTAIALGQRRREVAVGRRLQGNRSATSDPTVVQIADLLLRALSSGDPVAAEAAARAHAESGLRDTKSTDEIAGEPAR